MKKTLLALCLTLTCGVATAAVHAQEPLTLSSLKQDAAAAKAFKTLQGQHPLPAWVNKGSTDSQTKTVLLNGKEYWVLSACKPHDCAAEQLALLYSPQSHTMAGVFSTSNESATEQKLTWLNVSDDLSIDGKTVLFAALSGSLDNHPNSFNYQ
ncbi:MAG: Ivy family C-type lysozyme inhibitor [Plesiomonas sp.]